MIMLVDSTIIKHLIFLWHFLGGKGYDCIHAAWITKYVLHLYKGVGLTKQTTLRLL